MHQKEEKERQRLGLPMRISLLIVKFLHNQVQEQIDVHPHRPLKELHKLRVVELRLKQIVQRNLRIRAGNHHVPATALNGEDADLITRYRQVDSVPLPLSVAPPANKDAFVSEIAGRVLERAKFEAASRILKFALVIPLFCERH